MISSARMDFWQEETKLYNRPHPRLRLMARLLRNLPQRRLLDVGCSTAVLRELLPSTFGYFGCDITDHARLQLSPGQFEQIDFNQSSDLSVFAGKRIDVVHIGGVLEYLERPGDLLRNLRQLVKPGDPMLLSMINFESQRYAWPRALHPAWVYQPRLDDFRELLAMTGWGIERQIPFRGNGGAGGWFFRWWSGSISCDDPWTRRHARQFILLARAA